MEANRAKNTLTAGASLEVPISSAKMRMKHDQARRARLGQTFSPACTCIWKRSSGVRMQRAATAVATSDTSEPTTTVSSGPMKAATASAGSA